MFPYIDIGIIKIPMYGVMMAAGTLIGSALAIIRAHKRKLLFENMIIMIACAMGFAILGAVLLYTFVSYTPGEILSMIRLGQWRLLFGGLVFYGGLIGSVLGAFVGSLIAKADLRDYLDAAVPAVPLGHAFGRVGCFLAGCCYGRPTDSSIGVIYTQSIGGAPTGIRLLPIQLFEAGADILIFIILMIVSHKAKSKYTTTFLYFIMYGTVRFILEFFRYDSIRGIAGGLSTSQWISLGLIFFSLLFLLLYRIWKTKEKKKNHCDAKLAD